MFVKPAWSVHPVQLFVAVGNFVAESFSRSERDMLTDRDTSPYCLNKR
jgi:cobalamin biosynthesis protein CobD/CbiB